MTECTQSEWTFPAVKSRKVIADFKGGAITSNAGVLLLRQADRKIGLTREAASLMPDERCSGKVEHTLETMMRQRVYAIACGEEDLNDHHQLRNDLALQAATDCTEVLASPSTLCRFENTANRRVAGALQSLFVEKFIASYKETPDQVILDFDATDDPVHGHQEGRFFHGYYDRYCFLPLYVFCGAQLLCAYLRPSKIDGAKHTWAILSLLVKRLRRQWPNVQIIFRGDSGFCRWRMLRWCDNHRVDYIIGLAKNARLELRGAELMEKAKKTFEATGEKQRIFGEFTYAAGTWDRERRVIMKAEYTIKGSNPRFIVTSLKGDPQELYDDTYCGRGDMENRIKEQQLDLFADRTSCHHWWANQFRLLLSSMAYVLFETIRRLGLEGTELAKATCGTIRLKLIRIGAIVLRNTRRIRLHLSSAHPHQDIFARVVRRLE
jgi:hypothetical protein